MADKGGKRTLASRGYIVSYAGKSYSDELARALDRPDANILVEQIDAFIAHHAAGDSEWPNDRAEDFGEIITCFRDDPNRALAYVVLAASRTDDGEFLVMMGAGPLEDVLYDPSDELLERVVAEARKSARFRWLLSVPYKVAIAQRAWQAIEIFRVTGPHEEPAPETVPTRY
jgi:hypothetical protein